MNCACKWDMTNIWRFENCCLLSILVGLVTFFAADCDKLFVVISLTNWSIDHSCLRLLWSALANFFKTLVKTAERNQHQEKISTSWKNICFYFDKLFVQFGKIFFSILTNLFVNLKETSIKKRQILVKTFDWGDSILWSICLFWRIHFSIWKIKFVYLDKLIRTNMVFFYFDKFIFQFGGRKKDAGEDGWLFAEMGDCVLRVSIDIVGWEKRNHSLISLFFLLCFNRLMNISLWDFTFLFLQLNFEGSSMYLYFSSFGRG